MAKVLRSFLTVSRCGLSFHRNRNGRVRSARAMFAEGLISRSERLPRSEGFLVFRLVIRLLFRLGFFRRQIHFAYIFGQ